MTSCNPSTPNAPHQAPSLLTSYTESTTVTSPKPLLMIAQCQDSSQPGLRSLGSASAPAPAGRPIIAITQLQLS